MSSSPWRTPCRKATCSSRPQQLVDINNQLETLLAYAKNDAESDGARGVVTALLQGLPASQILEVAQREGTDLIVMGTHGRTGICHAFKESVAEHVLRRGPCSVLTVKAAVTRILQVIGNLISNASKFTPRGAAWRSACGATVGLRSCPCMTRA
jgi:nucleotide-binding universal stress UspA family protein